MSSVLTADQLLAARSYKTETLDAFGGKIVVRTLPMGGRIAIRERAYSRVGEKAEVDSIKFAAITLQFGVLEPRLTEAQAEQLVNEQAPEEIQPVVDAIWRLSGMKGEEAAKNG